MKVVGWTPTGWPGDWLPYPGEAELGKRIGVFYVCPTTQYSVFFVKQVCLRELFYPGGKTEENKERIKAAMRGYETSKGLVLIPEKEWEEVKDEIEE
jgi:hypothetical protein